MGKNVGLTYVKDFTFPAEQGFTGSAGVHKVRGYMRGGHVKKTGTANAAEGGYFGKPGDKYPTLKSGPKGKQGSSMPKNVKSHGGRVGLHKSASRRVPGTTRSAHGGSVHDKLKHEGGKMGYAYGGQVKPSNTSAQFKMTKGKQKTMDHGVQPAQKGRNQAEIEAGGNKRLKAGYMKGGGVHRTSYKKGGTAKKKKARQQLTTAQRLVARAVSARRESKGSISDYEAKQMRGLANALGTDTAANARILAKMREFMGVSSPQKKAHGGLVEYAQGGSIKKAVAAQ